MSNAILERPPFSRRPGYPTPIEGISLSTKAEDYFESLEETRIDSMLPSSVLGAPYTTGEPVWWPTPITLTFSVVLTEPTPVTRIPRAFLEIFESGFRTLSRLEVPEATPSEETVDPVAAAEELKDWLGLTWDELQAITGIAKNTFHDWRRTNRVQRPSKVRRLMRVHSLVRAVRAHLGPEGATEWFRRGPRSPLDLLLAGDLDSAEEAASVLLFRRERVERQDRHNYAPFAPEEDFEVDIEPRAVPPRRAQRRPRRGRLPR
jgi:uncharacterized protein (DUF2384 family)